MFCESRGVPKDPSHSLWERAFVGISLKLEVPILSSWILQVILIDNKQVCGKRVLASLARKTD